MKIAVGSDEKSYLKEVIVEDLRERGHELTLHGPLLGVEAVEPRDARMPPRWWQTVKLMKGSFSVGWAQV